MNKAEAIENLEGYLAVEERTWGNDSNTDFDAWRTELNQSIATALEALKNPLTAFLQEEVPYRLREVFGMSEDKITPELVEFAVRRLEACSDWAVLDLEAMDGFLANLIEDYELDRKTEQLGLS